MATAAFPARTGEDSTLRLVVRAQSADREALGLLYGLYADRVHAYVRGVVRDEHEAEDITQHVFLKLITAIDRYEPGAAPFLRWLLRVAHNVSIDHLRVRRPLPADDVLADEPAADRSAREHYRDFTEALEHLSPEQRTVVLLRHVCGLTPVEIADAMGRSEASIHGLHHRARHTLTRELAQLGAAPSTATRKPRVQRTV
jgi:RNA polymerase sigma-70 factor (ECF subfamily)